MLPLMVDFCDRLNDLHKDMEKAIAGLSVDALDWIPGDEMNSLCVLVVHTCGAERYWIGEMGGGDPAGRNRDDEFAAKGYDEAALKQMIADTHEHSCRTLESLSLDDLVLQRNWPVRNIPLTVAWSILHALEHTGLHLGHMQITRQLWDQRQAS